jgi:hypothetical protein
MPTRKEDDDEKDILLATQLSFLACVKVIEELKTRMSRLEKRVATLAAKVNSRPSAPARPRRRRAVDKTV